MYKILIVDADVEVQELFEEVLEEFVDGGGELLIAAKPVEGLALLHKEHPQLVFLSEECIGESLKAWKREGSALVLLGITKNKESLTKPLKARHILDKCHTLLGIDRSVPRLPPM